MGGYVVVNHAEARKRRKRIVKKIVWWVVAVIVLTIIVALWLYWRSLAPTVLEIVKVQVLSESTRAINEAVLAVFSQGVGYGDLVSIERNGAGEIVLLSANSVLTNNLARNTSLLAQTKINALFSDSIGVPLGTLSGIPLLNDVGPAVEVEVSPVGTVNCTFSSQFATAGINQTLHRIYIEVCGQVDLVMPTMHYSVQIKTPVLVCETVIVGKVPETFLQGSFALGAS